MQMSEGDNLFGKGWGCRAIGGQTPTCDEDISRGIWEDRRTRF